MQEFVFYSAMPVYSKTYFSESHAIFSNNFLITLKKVQTKARVSQPFSKNIYRCKNIFYLCCGGMHDKDIFSMKVH